MGFRLGLAGSDEDVYYEENGHTEDHKCVVITWNLSFILLIIKDDLCSF